MIVTGIKGGVRVPAPAPTSSDWSTLTSKPGHITDLPVSVTDYGADNTGAADSTVAFQNFAAALVGSGGLGKTGRIPNGTYKISDTITIAGAFAPVIRGESMWGTKLVWAGPATKPMWRILDTFDAYFEQFFIQSAAAAGTYTLAQAFWSETQGVAGPTVNSGNKWSHIRIDGVNGGIQYGWYFTNETYGLDENNDLSTFRNCQYNQLAEAGWYFNHSQSVEHTFYRCAGNGAKYVLHLAHGGFKWWGGNGGASSVSDFWIENASGGSPIVIDGWSSEGSAQFFKFAPGNATVYAAVIDNCRISDDVMTTGYAIVFHPVGPLAIRNTTFGRSRLSLLNAGIQGQVVIEGCAFQRDISTDPDYNSPWDTAPGAGAGSKFEVRGNMFADYPNWVAQDLRTLRNGASYIRAFSGEEFITANTAATTISNVYNGAIPGQKLLLLEGDTFTTVANSGTAANQIKTKTGANVGPGWGAMWLAYNGTYWRQV